MTRAVHSAEIAVPARQVWDALTTPEVRGWYFSLRADGEFVTGARVRWMRGEGGDPLEESQVLGVEPERRLALRTRLLFDAAVAAAPAFEVEWSLSPAGAGTHVDLTVEGEGAGAELLLRDGELVLKTLRVALDPGERAALARLPAIGEVVIVDVSAERVADYQAFFDRDAFRDYPAWQACYCVEPHHGQGSAESTGPENRALMSEMLADGRATALLAYAGGRPVGWCQYGRTTALAGILHRFGERAGDLEGVGSIACFVVAAPYRGHGIARSLLAAALERLRALSLREVEAYPPAAEGSPQASFRGPRRMYEASGFRVHREAGASLVMRKSLA